MTASMLQHQTLAHEVIHPRNASRGFYEIVCAMKNALAYMKTSAVSHFVLKRQHDLRVTCRVASFFYLRSAVHPEDYFAPYRI